MKRFCLLTLVCLPLFLQAALRTETEALNIARRVADRSTTIVARTNAYYAVNTEKGFVLVGADEASPEVLGWSDNGPFDLEILPPALIAWLQLYENEKVVSVKEQDVFDDEQQPLLTTQWNQGAPYYNLCPQAASNARCLTGCGATAMAQVMNFHKYPVQGTSSHSYNWTCPDCASGYRSSTVLSADFGSTTYDWNNMRDKYNSGYTSAEAQAVATLMYHCGVSLDMEYGRYNSNSSIWDAGTSLNTYFGYGSDMELIWKDYYTNERLLTILHDDIQLGRPVMVRGADNQGNGHIFACDGYNRSGYFHFNWGWGGSGDGYYRVTSLNPTGYNYRYNYGVQFLTKIHPDPDHTTRPHFIMLCDSMALGDNTVGRNTSLDVTAYEIRNYNYCTLNGKIGVMLTNAQTNEQVKLLWESGPFTDFSTSWGWSEYPILFYIPNKVPEGTYWLDMVYKSTDYDDPWETVRYLAGKEHGMMISITNSAITRIYDYPSQDITMVHETMDGRKKVLIDGHIYILSGDKVYSVVGQEVKQ